MDAAGHTRNSSEPLVYILNNRGIDITEVKLDHLLGAQKSKLVGGWTNPSEKYARQIGSFPQGWK